MNWNLLFGEFYCFFCVFCVDFESYCLFLFFFLGWKENYGIVFFGIVRIFVFINYEFSFFMDFIVYKNERRVFLG